MVCIVIIGAAAILYSTMRPSGPALIDPADRNILSDQEIIAVLAYIKSTWPPKVLQAQKEVTLQRQN